MLKKLVCLLDMEIEPNLPAETKNKFQKLVMHEPVAPTSS